MRAWINDLQFAGRALWRSPVFAISAIIVLAVGIGINSATFMWIDALLLNPIPGASQTDRLVVLTPTKKSGALSSMSYPLYKDFSQRTTSYDGIAAFDMRPVGINAASSTRRAWAILASDNYFEVLGVKPALGRLFSSADQLTDQRSVVISYAYWRNKFAGSRTVLGQSVRINKQPFVIVGVTSREFTGTYTGLGIDLWIPLAAQTMIEPALDRSHRRDVTWLTGIARLKSGKPIDQAQAEMDRLAESLGKDYAPLYDDARFVVYPLDRAPIGAQAILSRVVSLVFAITGLVLLIACSNVSGLLLARSLSQRRQVAIRMALGASRWQLFRTIFDESLIVAALAGIAAFVLATVTSNLLAGISITTEFPIIFHPQANAALAFFTILVSIVTSLVFSVTPAFILGRAQPAELLKSDSLGSVGGGRALTLMQNGLVVAQVGLAFVLIVCAGLFLRALNAARHLDLGFDPEGITLATIDLSFNSYSPQQGLDTYGRILARLTEKAGSNSICLATAVPLRLVGDNELLKTRSEAQSGMTGAGIDAPVNRVTPGYFSLMHIGLVGGRDFNAHDLPGSPPVVIVNEAMANLYWQGQDALGKTFLVDKQPTTVVGVVRTIHTSSLEASQRPYLYLPLMQEYRSSAVLHMRSNLTQYAASQFILDEVRNIDPDVALYSVQPLRSYISASLLPQQLGGEMMGLFGGLALSLVSVGMYGTVAYLTARRRREIGVRIVLGSSRRRIFMMVLGDGLKNAFLGISIGFVISLALSRLLRSLLVGIKPWDPLTYALSAALICTVLLLACFLPALNATGEDPAVILRNE